VIDEHLRKAKTAKAYESEVTYVQGIYGAFPKDLDVSGKVIIMADFSYKHDVIATLSSSAKHILILDHHASAERDLVNLPHNVTVDFRMDESGSTVAWKFFNPTKRVPPLLQHIKDRDLWLFKLDGTKEISAALFSYPYEFNTINMFAYAPEVLVIEGEAIVRRATADIKSLLPIVTRNMNIAGYIIPVANMPVVFTSEAGNMLSENEPFAACYWDTPGGRVFSLRSKDGGEDVSKIAEQYGGGGHKHAAGFKVSFEESRSFEIN
jgi:oligoribonuclease NrnB/cAMP/cGMP phosphodiesterase (DHH superfamily)